MSEKASSVSVVNCVFLFYYFFCFPIVRACVSVLL